MTDLLKLAERCEQATGPDRALDRLIANTQGSGAAFQLQEFTASLDAAMTLYIHIPERVPSDPRKAAAEALRQRAEAK